MMNFMMMMMATQTRARKLIKLLERLLNKRELFDDDQVKLIKEQLKVAKDELARIEEQTSKGFGNGSKTY